jgi:predicted acetyltransferase
MSVIARRMTEADRDRAFRIFLDSFGAGPDRLPAVAELPLTDRWVGEDADSGRIVGTLRELVAAQSFGGRFVPSSLVAAVGVGLTDRSRGVGRALMSGWLRARHDDGVPLSTLYMSTMAAYRPVGYELAGTRVSYQVPLEHLPREQPLAVEEWDEGDLAEVSDCYRRVSLERNGMMDRPEWWWEPRVFNDVPPNAFLYRYRVIEAGRTTGYVVYTLRPDARPDFPIHWAPEHESFAVVARELVWETAAAARSLLGFLAAQRTIGKDLYWNGPANDPLLTFFPEHHPTLQGSYTWMTRIVHVSEALRLRGYPTGLDAEVRLQVVDPVVQGNDGPVSLIVRDGRAEVGPASRADLQVTVNGLASLYSGWMSAYDATRAGLLTGATAQELAILARLFQGTSPYLNEMF